MPDTATHTRLTLNDGGSVTVPTKAGVIRLSEADVDIIDELWNRMIEGDWTLERLATEMVDADESGALTFDQAKKKVATGKDSPYVATWLWLIEAVDGAQLERSQLYPWATNGRSLRVVFDHWQVPLAGSESSEVEDVIASLIGRGSVPPPSTSAPTNGQPARA